jgi:flagellar biosynthesis component FlhA
MLDSLPGKQISIEAEFNNGAISEEEASGRQDRLRQKCDFLGSLDGAVRFIHGTSKGKMLILCLGIIGSLIIAAVDHGESISDLTFYPDGMGILIKVAVPSIYYLIISFLILQLPNLFMIIMAGLITKKAEDDI